MMIMTTMIIIMIIMMIIMVRIMIKRNHLSLLRLWLRSDEMDLKSRDLSCELRKGVQQLLLSVPIKPDNHHDNDFDCPN